MGEQHLISLDYEGARGAQPKELDLHHALLPGVWRLGMTYYS